MNYVTTTNNDHLSNPELKKQAEKLLNFNIDKHNVEITEDHSGLKLVTVEVSANRTREAKTYRVQICPVCGEAQPATLQTIQKTNPDLAETVIKEMRREQAKEYVRTGEQPASNDLLESRAENKLVGWDNSTCEARHPPRRD